MEWSVGIVRERSAQGNWQVKGGCGETVGIGKQMWTTEESSQTMTLRDQLSISAHKSTLTHSSWLRLQFGKMATAPPRITHAACWSGKTFLGQSWNVHEGDAKCVVSTLPDNSYNCVVTSPPYYWLRDYGVEGQIGQEETVLQYVKAMADAMDEVYRVLTDDGIVFL